MQFQSKQVASAIILAATLTCTTCWSAGAAEYRLADVQEEMKHLSSTDHEETISAVSKLASMGPIAEPATAQLIRILETDPVNTTRGACAQALGNIGPAAVSAVPSLIAFLQNKDCGYERAYAPTALGDIGQQPDIAVPALINALNHDEEPVVRGLSAQALGSFGANASISIPDLVEALKNGNKELRGYAAYALCKIPARASDLPLLVPLLADEIDSIREAAAKSIGGAKADGAPAIPQLISLLSDNNMSVAAAAATALGNLGPCAKSSVSALKLAQKNAQLRYESTQALKQISGR